MHQRGAATHEIKPYRPLRFLLIVASALILLIAEVRAQNVTIQAGDGRNAADPTASTACPELSVLPTPQTPATSGSIRGVDYGPFRDGENPNLGIYPSPDVLEAHVNEDFQTDVIKTADTVRVYSVARRFDYIVKKALASGRRAIPSAFLVKGSDSDNEKELNCLYELLSDPSIDLSKIPFAVIGSEAILPSPGTYSDTELIAFINQAQQRFPNIKFASAERWTPYYLNDDGGRHDGTTRLGDAVNVIFVNILPYWENISIDAAVPYVVDVVSRLKSKYPNKRVVISETGWPSAGAMRFSAIPSPENQQRFWREFLEAARQNDIEFFGFEAFDESWKGSVEPPTGQNSPGPHWGLWDANRQPKGRIVSFSAFQVSPATNMVASGNQGGPFSPPSFSYQLSATSGSVDYAISGTPSWLVASSTSGTVTTSPTTVTFTINASASSLAAGTYGPSTISFANTSDGQGDTTRTATLTVTPPSTLQVTPAANMVVTGNQGGPFSPASFDYQLSASSGSVNYSITGLPSWLIASTTSGTATTGGGTVTFTVSAGGLSPGRYAATVSFTNMTSGGGNQTRSATLAVNVGPGNPTLLSRTFVSANGDDGNNCSRPAPCRSFAGAIAKTYAGGEINVLDAGGYGTVVIDKPLSIVNDGAGSAGVLVPPGNTGIVIGAGPSDMIHLRGLIIDGAGTGQKGVVFNSGKSLTIENSVIRNLASDGLQFLPNASSTLSISNLLVADNGGSGIALVPSGAGTVMAALRGIEAYNNANSGVLLSGGSTGMSNATATDSVSSRNGTGFSVMSGGALTSLILRRSVASANTTGLLAQGTGATLRAAQSTVTGNTTGLAATGGGSILSYVDNYIDGNAGGETASGTSAMK
ncbi:MAG: hypothetical protein QOI12_4186 [Alphaproteobacteria bacterium]|nr:hypothetical protein [Alphaproteobacteria bacterium]